MPEIDALESHEWELFDENRLLDHHLVVFKVGKERHEAREEESRKFVIYAEVELANAKEALHVLESRV